MEPKSKFYRWLEMIPGSLVWVTFALAIILSFVRPLWVMYFIILFDLYWLFRIAYFLFFLVVSLRRYRRAIRTDWLAKARELPGFGALRHLIFLPTYKEDIEIIRTTLKI